MSVTLSALYTTIRLEIQDEAQTGVTPEFTDAQLDTFITRAVERYSRLAPHVMRENINTVAYQDAYAVNANAFSVRKVEWRPSAGSVLPYNADPFWFNDWQDDALIVVRNQLIRNYDNIGRTSWAEINYSSSFMGGRYVRLFPCPTDANQKVDVWYNAPHPLNAGSTGYDTIPSMDIDSVAQFAIAIILRRRARTLLALPDQTVGQSNRVGSDPARTLEGLARYYEERAINSLSSPVATRS